MLRRLDGLLQGDYRTLLRGFGLDLADLREYQYHDDVRHIDWNVTARLQTPYVREFTEDREMTAWFLLDLSPSIDFGSGDVRKRSVSADFVAVLARMLTRHGNRVGAALYGETWTPWCRRRRRAGMCCTCCTACCIGRAVAPIIRHRPAGDFLRAAFPAHLAALAGLRRLRLHQRRLGGGARASRASATRSSRCGSTTRSSWSCPTWDC